MASEAPAVVCIAGEDHAHRILATRLLDAVLLDAAGDRLDPESLPDVRAWCGIEANPDSWYCTLSNPILDFKRKTPLKFIIPRIDDKPAQDAAWFVALYRLVRHCRPDAIAIVALQDTDHDEKLRRHAERAWHYIQTELENVIPTVFGLPHREAEAWFVAMLRDIEPKIHKEARRALPFDPLTHPHKLTANARAANTDTKRALRFLTGQGEKTLEGTSQSAMRCDEYENLAAEILTDTARALAAHPETGLPAFVEELRALAPHILAPPAPPDRPG